MRHSAELAFPRSEIVGAVDNDQFVPEKTLFSDSDLSEYLAQKKQEPRNILQSYDPDKLLLTAETDLIEYVTNLGLVDEIELLRDDAHVLDAEEFMKESAASFQARWGNAWTQQPVTRWTLVVPFNGEPRLFFARASTYLSASPRGEISGYELRINYDSDYGSTEPAQIKAFFDRELDQVQEQLGYINKDIAEHNRVLRHQVPGWVGERRAKHLRDKQTQAELGFPVKKRSDASSFAVPMNRRSLTTKRPTPPQPTERAFAPEPTLADADYESALAVLINSRNAIERNPSTAAKLDEEGIRDLLLINLNAQFQGKAAGEVFNGAGKTDILIREDDRNVFIGECKIWGGPKRFTAAVDQLLSYSTWRDTKAALLIFVKGGDFTSITANAVAAMEAHPNFKRRGKHANEDRHDFVLHANGDTNREIKLALMLFMIADPKAATTDEQ